MKPKQAKNLSLPAQLRALAEGYCEANHRTFADYVSGLLRDDLRKAGLPVDATPEDVLRHVHGSRRGKIRKPKKPKPSRALITGRKRGGLEGNDNKVAL